MSNQEPEPHVIEHLRHIVGCDVNADHDSHARAAQMAIDEIERLEAEVESLSLALQDHQSRGDYEMGQLNADRAKDDEIVRLRAEVATLQAQATTYWVERDAVIDMCILTHVESGERWSFVGDFDKIPYVSMIKSMTKADAIRAVRIAAGLDHDAMTIEEVDAELARRGIDITPAWAKVKAAIAKAKAAPSKAAT